MPFIYHLTSEPKENWEFVEMEDHSIHVTSTASRDQLDDDYVSMDEHDSIAAPADNDGSSVVVPKKKKGFFSRAAKIMFCTSTDDLCLPVQIHDVYELMHDDSESPVSGEFQCHLWQRSIFYSKAHLSSHSWQLRWFKFAPSSDVNGGAISSVPDRWEPTNHVIEYPPLGEIHVDERRLIVHVINPVDGKRDFTFMAPSRSIFGEVVQRMTTFIESNNERGATTTTMAAAALADELSSSPTTATGQTKKKGEKVHDDLIAFPAHGASTAEIIVSWAFLYPLRFLMHHTLPDVRRLDRHGDPTIGSRYAYLSATSCLVWLIAGSYVMVRSLETLAELIHVPDAVVGFTVSAAGTSLPAYVASRIAAENGFGNQAVSNVFGSNTFNITVGLGLPWVIYTSFVTGFEPYDELLDEGLTVSILILAGALVLFVVLMILTDFVLLRWHGVLFIALYVAYIVFAIGQAHIIGNDENRGSDD